MRTRGDLRDAVYYLTWIAGFVPALLWPEKVSTLAAAVCIHAILFDFSLRSNSRRWERFEVR